MKIDDLIPSKYLKQSDVPEDTLVTVKELKKQNVAQQDEEAEYKYIIFFEEFPKGMVLNSTNIKRMGKALGNDTDMWIGGKVVLYVDPNVEYGGNVTGGLRIRASRKPSTVPRKPSDDEANRKLREAAKDEFADDIPFK